MCGIVGYIGKQDGSEIIFSGLKRLEYRGYDSYGICFIEKDKYSLFKRIGKIEKTEKEFLSNNFKGNTCIAHNRWATTGIVSEENAHPHCDCKEEFFVVHNGIVENYKELKNILIKEGHIFRSETDTEVIAHLIEKYYQGNLENAVKKSLNEIRGTYGLVVASTKEPEKLVVARMSSPLIIGVGDNEFLVASDPSAIISRTRQIINLDDGEIAVIRADDIRIYKEEKESKKDVQTIDWDIEVAQKGGYDHFMLKEIMEEPNVIEDAMRGRLLEEEGMVKLGGLESVESQIKQINSLCLVGCGTAYYACKVGKYMIEEYADIPVEVDFGSEFRYKKPIIKKDGAVLFVSQSGETADTLSCLKEMKGKGVLTLGITNVV
jgi:glucosamine--fructose-6-phosphate aminotransferase (isomerizing)